MLHAVHYSNKIEVAYTSNLPWMMAAVLNLHDKMEHAVGTSSNQCKTCCSTELAGGELPHRQRNTCPCIWKEIMASLPWSLIITTNSCWVQKSLKGCNIWSSKSTGRDTNKVADRQQFLALAFSFAQQMCILLNVLYKVHSRILIGAYFTPYLCHASN